MYNKRKVFLSACLTMLLFGVVAISLGAILPALMSRFEMAESQAGKLLSIFPFGLIVGSIGFGPFVDRYGYQLIFIIGGVLTFVGIEGIALAEDVILIESAVLLTGIGGGLMNGSANAVVADISPNDNSSKLSLLGVFFGIGALTMPVFLGILSESFSYGTIMMFIGLLVIFSLIIIFFIRFPQPKQSMGFPLVDIIKLCKDPLLILASLLLLFQTTLEGLTNYWTTTFLIETNNYSNEEALYTLSIYVAGLTIMRLFLGYFLRKTKPFKVLILSMFLCLVGSLLLLKAGDSYAILALFLLGVGYAGGFPIIIGYISTMYKDLSGTAISFALAIALFGNMVGNFLMGIIAEAFGIIQLPMVLVILLVAMIVILFYSLIYLSKRINI